LSVAEPDLIPMWPDGLPDSDIQHDRPEQTVNGNVDQNGSGLNRAISRVTNPGLYVYPADPSMTAGDAILVWPGGAAIITSP
jgi:hypothetical protein